MRIFAQEQNQSQKPVYASSVRSNMATARQNYHEHPILNLPRTIGNQAIQRLLQVNAEGFEAGSGTFTTTYFTHDFKRITIYSKAPVSSQAKLTVNTPGDIYEQEADAMADKVMRMSDNHSPPLMYNPSPARSLSEGLASMK